MKNLLLSFEKLHKDFQNNREWFKKRLDKFKRGKDELLYNQAQQLFQDLEKLTQELKHDFSLTAEGSTDQAVIKSKLKVYKKSYKELVEITKPIVQQWIEAVVVAFVLAAILRNFIFGLYHVPTGSAEPNILVGDRIWGNKMAYYIGDVKRGDLVIFDNPEHNYGSSGSINYYWQKYVGLGIPLLGLGNGPDNWVKRVIAVPGDTIEGRIEDGKTTIYLNNEKLDEPYVNTYPLIRVKKEMGFIGLSHVGPFAIPSFLQKKDVVITGAGYTYDPSKSLEDQPFYYLKEHEVVRKSNGEPFLSHAFAPIPVVDFAHPDIVYSVDSFGPITVPQGKYWVMGDSRKNSRDSRYWGFLDKNLIHGRASFIIFSIDSEEPFWLFALIKSPIEFWSKYARWNRSFKGLNGFGEKNLDSEKKHA